MMVSFKPIFWESEYLIYVFCSPMFLLFPAFLSVNIILLVRPQTSFNATGQIRRNRDLGTDRPNDGNRNDRNQSDSNRDPVGAGIVSHPLDQASRRELAQLPHVLEVYPEFRFTGDLRFGPAGHLTQVTSLPMSASASDSLEGMQGRFFSATDAHEIILQADAAADLADSQHL